jgi:hypothetical protein
VERSASVQLFEAALLLECYCLANWKTKSVFKRGQLEMISVSSAEENGKEFKWLDLLRFK